MKYIRWFLVAIVVAYAAWIAFPVMKAVMFPDHGEPTIASRTMDQDDYAGGFNAPDMGQAPQDMNSIQGETAVEAVKTRNTPVVALWGAVVFLYLVAAWLHANGNVRAAFTYLLGFLADLVLTYVTKGSAGGGIMDKLFSILSGWDPRYVITLVALVLGFLIYMSRRRPQPRISGALPT
ncbi:hypothetical protein [Asticcacaulis sp. AC402]|uniref:hypothetical protein n=1 Tax=Asticcacaulis sp. AC402 TaxID=1282361 RepID=UPI0003C3B33D|nr:hypothetical protein [Asticcacaulis sp. AC402]ESQ74850.1 hypothetical protein ABAC402_11905 [Asticcacaulis sp. AC402]